MQPPEFVLSYWNLRGTTQALRNLLEYLGVNYQDRIIDWPNDLQYDPQQMPDYPRMPNLKHGNFEVTQIVPIGKYLCRITNRTDLLGKTLKDQILIDTLISQAFQARKVYLDAMTSLGKQNEAVFQKQMLEKMKGIRETFLQDWIQRLSSREWYVGYFTLADFFLYNVLFYFQGFVPDLVANETLDKFMIRFESIERLNKYFKSGKSNHPPSLSEDVNKYWIGKRNYK